MRKAPHENLALTFSKKSTPFFKKSRSKFYGHKMPHWKRLLCEESLSAQNNARNIKRKRETTIIENMRRYRFLTLATVPLSVPWLYSCHSETTFEKELVLWSYCLRRQEVKGVRGHIEINEPQRRTTEIPSIVSVNSAWPWKCGIRVRLSFFFIWFYFVFSKPALR